MITNHPLLILTQRQEKETKEELSKIAAKAQKAVAWRDLGGCHGFLGFMNSVACFFTMKFTIVSLFFALSHCPFKWDRWDDDPWNTTFYFGKGASTRNRIEMARLFGSISAKIYLSGQMTVCLMLMEQSRHLLRSWCICLETWSAVALMIMIRHRYVISTKTRPCRDCFSRISGFMATNPPQKVIDTWEG